MSIGVYVYTRLISIKTRPVVGFALTVPSAPFCTSTTAGGTGRVQPRLLCKKRDHPVTSDRVFRYSSKAGNIALIFSAKKGCSHSAQTWLKKSFEFERDRAEELES